MASKYFVNFDCHAVHNHFKLKIIPLVTKKLSKDDAMEFVNNFCLIVLLLKKSMDGGSKPDFLIVGLIRMLVSK